MSSQAYHVWCRESCRMEYGFTVGFLSRDRGKVPRIFPGCDGPAVHHVERSCYSKSCVRSHSPTHSAVPSLSIHSTPHLFCSFFVLLAIFFLCFLFFSLLLLFVVFASSASSSFVVRSGTTQNQLSLRIYVFMVLGTKEQGPQGCDREEPDVQDVDGSDGGRVPVATEVSISEAFSSC